MRASPALPIAARGAAAADQAEAVLEAGLALARDADWDGLARRTDAALEVEVADLNGHIDVVGHYAASLKLAARTPKK